MCFQNKFHNFKFLSVACSVFYWIWRLCFGESQGFSPCPKWQQGQRSKRGDVLRQIVRHLPSWNLFGVDLGRWREGLRISKRQRNGINICRKHLGCINFGHPFLSKLFLKVPKHWRKNCGSNRTAYFFLLDPWVFSFNLTRYVFREVNHLVIGFHDWTKHQTWVCTNPLDKNWISSRQIWSLGHVEIHAIMVGHPKSKWSKTFPHP